MTIEVRVPQLPESVADATLVAWRKKAGDAVTRDENLVDLETDKVVLEVTAPAAGVLKEIKLGDGTTVTSGQLLAVIDEGATALPGASAPAIMSGAGGATSAKSAAAAAPAASTSSVSAASAKLSPAAKRVVEENKVDASAVAGSGRDGRVSKSDVVNYLAAKDAEPAVQPIARAPSQPPSAPAKSSQIPETRGGPWRAASSHDAPAGANRRPHGASASKPSIADLLQRGRSEVGERSASALQG